MKRLHKINVIFLWVCAIALISIVTLSKGLNDPSVIKSDIGMAAGITIITVLYFSKANNVVKGSGVTVIASIGCLITSIAQGGNKSTFMLSFIMMGMALLYFNKKIIISYLSIYIPICLAAGIINPAFIAGPGATTTQCMEYIFAYTILGILMIIATNRGGRLVSESNRMLNKIKADSQTTAGVIKQLNASMEESSQNIESLTKQIQAISDATHEMESLTKSMGTSANLLGDMVSDTMNALNQNNVLNKELEKRFEEVGAAVENGSSGAMKIKSMLDSMKETVLAAGEATDVLLGKISSVNTILKEINKITMRTNMLSINASIEAAKAGASGKGFAVVANEIKSLADESNESAKGIQEIIAELSRQVDDVAAKTSAGTKSAIAGMESMEQLISILEDIKNTNDIAAGVVHQETQTNNEVNTKFETVSSEIDILITGVININEAVASVASDIYKQNEAIRHVNEEIGKMKAVTGSLNKNTEY
ncbi:MAG: hypothetical protein GX488_04015 [Clostridiales bacterium]|nr:hypothetical protein [Clostridiales bacterium]